LRQHAGCLFGWLVRCLVGRSVGRSVGRPVGRLVDGLVGWLVGWLVVRLVGWAGGRATNLSLSIQVSTSPALCVGVHPRNPTGHLARNTTGLSHSTQHALLHTVLPVNSSNKGSPRNIAVDIRRARPRTALDGLSDIARAPSAFAAPRATRPQRSSLGTLVAGRLQMNWSLVSRS
jgi:hypothetical protein